MTMKLGLLYGGKSAEHQVSLQTAKAVINALDFERYEVHPIYITVTGRWIRGHQLTSSIENASELKFEEGSVISPTALNQSVFPSNENDERSFDIIFPLLHGPNGEDGTVQGLLELLDIPYVGNGVLASSAGMDKVIMKNIYAQAGIRQPSYVWYTRNNYEKDPDAACSHVEKVLGFPCFVKPANLGSSVGISKASTQEELLNAFQTAFDYDRKVIVEEGINGREVEISVLGNDEPECSVAGEIVPKADFYDYNAKYEDNSTGLIIPAEISDEEYDTIRAVAVQSFKALDCSGLVRADFFLTKDGKVLMNEVNTMPGFTPVSMFPLLWQKSGITYSELIEKMIQLGLERYEEKQRIKHTF